MELRYYDPKETWAIAQARSILGRADATLEDAKALSAVIDLATRRRLDVEIPGPPEPPSYIRAAASLRALFARCLPGG